MAEEYSEKKVKKAMDTMAGKCFHPGTNLFNTDEVEKNLKIK